MFHVICIAEWFEHLILVNQDLRTELTDLKTVIAGQEAPSKIVCPTQIPVQSKEALLRLDDDLADPQKLNETVSFLFLNKSYLWKSLPKREYKVYFSGPYILFQFLAQNPLFTLIT